MEDTKDYLTNFTDRNNYTLHIKVTQIVADAILRLSDSAVIPYSIQNIAEVLVNGKNIIKQLNSSHVSSGEKFFFFSKCPFLAIMLPVSTHAYKQSEKSMISIKQKIMDYYKVNMFSPFF